MQNEYHFEIIISKIKKIISGHIKNQIASGNISYERQLQAELFNCLRSNLFPEFNIWVEHIIKLEPFNFKIYPDLILTRNNDIVSIIELKFLIFGNPNIEKDMEKFQKLKKFPKDNLVLFENIELNNPNQDSHIVNQYRLIENFLSILIVFGKENCDAFKLNDIEKPSNFLQFSGYFNKDHNLKIEYKMRR